MSLGDTFHYGNEIFNVTDYSFSSVTMLAQNNLGTNYRQSPTANYVTFSNSNGWKYTPGPRDINIYSYEGNVKTYVNKKIVDCFNHLQ